ncbi:hypothetical protein DPMN_127207 [Dreissena polymorpha]|uniref:Uncharacterized protein n=1 Tax=Dreissena polymorpha TaxID=45954 RepID=A0A9D4H4T4_DREPO|nr:hypothetical protein DPMN_127207 [Dreissena polymorpha]
MLLDCSYQLVQFWILFFIWNLACDKAINKVTNYIIFIIGRWRVLNPQKCGHEESLSVGTLCGISIGLFYLAAVQVRVTTT